MKKITVKKLTELLVAMVANGQIRADTEVWLSSDEEGNSFGPLIQSDDGEVNIGIEDDKSKLTLYPANE